MSREDARKLAQSLRDEAIQGGYILNPDEEMVLDLAEGLLTNEKRFGYWACPCRDPDGQRAKDLDIICPCDYRDPDLEEFGTCYCALYVSQDVVDGKRKLGPIPERRPLEAEETQAQSQGLFNKAALPVWRCKVCGYLAAREKPPLKCPICKADQDRFERFA